MAKKSQHSNDHEVSKSKTDVKDATNTNHVDETVLPDTDSKTNNMRELQKKLAMQRTRLIQAAEESYLQNGNLLENKVAEEANKFFALSDSLCEDEEE